LLFRRDDIVKLIEYVGQETPINFVAFYILLENMKAFEKVKMIGRLVEQPNYLKKFVKNE